MAIPTTYKDIEYRSRLEAKWAAFFTRIGWEFTYEPFDGDGYIPDFLIHANRPVLIEVKPATVAREYRAAVPKMEKGLVKHWSHDVAILGVSPLPEWGKPDLPYGVDTLHNGALYGSKNHEEHRGHFLEEIWDHLNHPWYWITAAFWKCNKCGEYTFNHFTGCDIGYEVRGQLKCGHKPRFGEINNTAEIARIWAQATNDVKWNAR